MRCHIIGVATLAPGKEPLICIWQQTCWGPWPRTSQICTSLSNCWDCLQTGNWSDPLSSPHICYFLMPSAKNIFSWAQSLIHTASGGYSLFAIWHPLSAVWNTGNYVKRDLEYMLHGRESQISIFLIISVVAACRKSRIVSMPWHDCEQQMKKALWV